MLNAVIAGQMIMYWNKGEGAGRRIRTTEEGKSEPSPIGKTEHGQARQWTRKLD